MLQKVVRHSYIQKGKVWICLIDKVRTDETTSMDTKTMEKLE